MTQKQFKEALLRGQGRCIWAVRSDPAKYYSVVLWACSHTVMSFKLSIGKTAITAEDMYTNEAIMAFINKEKYEIDN